MAYVVGATLRTQWPKVPKVTVELFASLTLRMAMSLITGAEIVVMRRRMEEMKMRATPKVWSQRNMIARGLVQWGDIIGKKRLDCEQQSKRRMEDMAQGQY
jgi:hypothetical protein